ncbi:hypothetical protein COT42_01215 [Candidatus Saganbacteria bacterium CG08_land_8_20_14_0_20_45_16]|uniref:Uncharacterized protein n=1 Tax=Candidatus Saganbacteria bacterium CG08_land_8_20_14_0_20_45_16 TaxID=2014293 RepID=A0A2H0Y1B2_UNCSA|nr:MAG: hypothetical protein COT42_01215 [Candidatus Saganbacteria bacterium CG08_land_8_20_14_0_20_45_16]
MFSASKAIPQIFPPVTLGIERVDLGRSPLRQQLLAMVKDNDVLAVLILKDSAAADDEVKEVLLSMARQDGHPCRFIAAYALRRG